MTATGGEEVFVLALADVDPPTAGADHDTCARLAGAQPRITPRFTSGDHAKQRSARIALRIRSAILLVVTIQRVSVGDRHWRH